MDRALRRGLGERGCHEPERLAEPERDPPVVGADPPGAHPHDVAARAERVEIGRAVSPHARTQHLGLDDRGGDRGAL